MIEVNNEGIFIDNELKMPFNYTQLLADLSANMQVTTDLYTYGELVTTNNIAYNYNSDNDFEHDYADIYPPEGYTINDLAGFIASSATMEVRGYITFDAVLYCRYKIMDDRIRVISNSSYSNKDTKINYLAIWRKS